MIHRLHTSFLDRWMGSNLNACMLAIMGLRSNTGSSLLDCWESSTAWHPIETAVPWWLKNSRACHLTFNMWVFLPFAVIQRISPLARLAISSPSTSLDSADRHFSTLFPTPLPAAYRAAESDTGRKEKKLNPATAQQKENIHTAHPLKERMLRLISLTCPGQVLATTWIEKQKKRATWAHKPVSLCLTL